jgi:hypothetical protein
LINVAATPVVPEGTPITFYIKHGMTISDRAGRRVERGSRFGLRRYKYFPGQEVPNYTLLPPTRLGIRTNSMTVDNATYLSDLLKPDMGNLDWAACREISLKVR